MKSGSVHFAMRFEEGDTVMIDLEEAKEYFVNPYLSGKTSYPRGEVIRRHGHRNAYEIQLFGDSRNMAWSVKAKHVYPPSCECGSKLAYHDKKEEKICLFCDLP